MKTKFEKRISFEKAHVFLRKYRNLRNIPHWHREHELVFVERGVAEVTCGGSFFTLQTGEAAFLHSEEIHSISAEVQAVVTVVKFDTEHLHRIVGNKHLCAPQLTGQYDLAAQLEELRREQLPGLEYGGIVADSIATRLMAQIFRTEASELRTLARNDTAEKYKELLERINTDYAYMTFRDAAELMHFSKPYFSKYFYQSTGMTFSRYLNMVRVSAAAELIRRKEKSITEIAGCCGFNTIRNFNRVFKELTSYAPGSLPEDYDVTSDLREYADNGFDPTLGCTEILT